MATIPIRRTRPSTADLLRTNMRQASRAGLSTRSGASSAGAACGAADSLMTPPS